MTGIVSSEAGDSTGIIATTSAGAALNFAGKQAHLRDEVTLGTSEIENVLITPDPDAKTMVFLTVGTDQGVTLELFEGADASGGTPLPLVNYNRESQAPDILTTAATAPTIINDGNLLLEINSTRRQILQSDLFSGEQSFILNRTMKYIFRVTSLDNNNNIAIKVILTKLRDVDWF